MLKSALTANLAKLRPHLPSDRGLFLEKKTQRFKASKQASTAIKYADLTPRKKARKAKVSGCNTWSNNNQSEREKRARQQVIQAIPVQVPSSTVKPTDTKPPTRLVSLALRKQTKSVGPPGSTPLSNLGLSSLPLPQQTAPSTPQLSPSPLPQRRAPATPLDSTKPSRPVQLLSSSLPQQT